MLETKNFYKISKVDEETINKYKVSTNSNAIIPYKDWKQNSNSKPVWKVPIEYCKFRLENGRIKTEILTHEKLKGTLDPNAQSTQDIIAGYLQESDPSKNKDLKELLKKDGQTEAAVITADGFLINGNRRKLALTLLNEKFPDEKYKTMKVVILPGSNDPERPTEIDIALLENRYQLYVDGKSEYSEMNKALTYYHHEKSGINIKDLLKEDASYGNLNEKQLEQKANDFKESYFVPIELMKQYLELNNINGDFNRVTDRWQSFKELRKVVLEPLDKEKNLVLYNLQKNDIGLIQNAAFNLIKLKDASSVVHQNRDLIRLIPKALALKDGIGKKEIFKIGKIEDSNENIKDPDEKDLKWQKDKGVEVLNIVKKLSSLIGKQDEQEDPLDRLSESLQKIMHKDLEIEKIVKMSAQDADSAMKMCNKIQAKSKKLANFFYDKSTGVSQEDLQDLIKRFNKD